MLRDPQPILICMFHTDLDLRTEGDRRLLQVYELAKCLAVSLNEGSQANHIANQSPS